MIKLVVNTEFKFYHNVRLLFKFAEDKEFNQVSYLIINNNHLITNNYLSIINY